VGGQDHSRASSLTYSQAWFETKKVSVDPLDPLESEPLTINAQNIVLECQHGRFKHLLDNCLSDVTADACEFHDITGKR
jgi:hypothetical protein